MKYIIRIKDTKSELTEFIEKNKNITIKKISPQIISLCYNIKTDWLNKYWVQITLDWLPWSLRKIEFIFNEIKSNNSEDREYYSDRLESYLISFFHYYKSALEIINKNFEKWMIENDLLWDITYIRNYFAHAYEKWSDQEKEQKLFIRLSMNSHNPILYTDKYWLHNLTLSIYEIEVFDFDNSQKIGSLYININLLYNKLYNILKKINQGFIKK